MPGLCFSQALSSKQDGAGRGAALSMPLAGGPIRKAVTVLFLRAMSWAGKVSDEKCGTLPFAAVTALFFAPYISRSFSLPHVLYCT